MLVYNLEVEDFHSYFVGNVPVLVHNRCGTEPKRNADGGYSDGNYNMSPKGNSDHNSGSNRLREGDQIPASQFLYDVDDVKATFDAASYADSHNLWINNKATVYVTNGPVGVTGSGQLTSYITVARTDTHFIHGWPSNPK